MYFLLVADGRGQRVEGEGAESRGGRDDYVGDVPVGRIMIVCCCAERGTV